MNQLEVELNTELARLENVILEEARNCFAWAAKYRVKDPDRAERHRQRGLQLLNNIMPADEIVRNMAAKIADTAEPWHPHGCSHHPENSWNHSLGKCMMCHIEALEKENATLQARRDQYEFDHEQYIISRIRVRVASMGHGGAEYRLERIPVGGLNMEARNVKSSP